MQEVLNNSKHTIISNLKNIDGTLNTIDKWKTRSHELISKNKKLQELTIKKLDFKQLDEKRILETETVILKQELEESRNTLMQELKTNDSTRQHRLNKMFRAYKLFGETWNLTDKNNLYKMHELSLSDSTGSLKDEKILN